MIKFEELSFAFDNEEGGNGLLFNKLNLHVKCGEYLSLIGSNGSGKTTLAMLAKGIQQPSKGKIYYKGEDISLKGINPKIGYIFSNPENQIVSSLVNEDVAFGPENQGRSSDDIKDAVKEALGLSKIEHLKNSLTHLLSGGEQQKVVIAGILAMDVECIIFDEAASMLDPVSKHEVLSLLQKLNKNEGITIIHITHNVGDIIGSDRIIVMEGGEIVFEGTPELLLHDEALMNSNKIKSRGRIRLVNKLLKNEIISRDDLACSDSMANSICLKKMG